ncbi:MAG: 16S rRNA (guanine(527)-N(7))-methyltransferase RsmG [Tabrizicola sp.]|uniref:16S rRNA (guanine(527)-N(7))-methyltransferase RsmG n=1 Tax=Tabrizicola sp. TaxID=2005166 RepID=UPI0027354B66|nr:16S rRNA (guanine(527)-N(7))-methyltransferase RsmG [Tabrizicola sp.]MDP3261647.1 16S rRNA (guanine(527)-N(7))-methyltransferase RsmG [Tabrizicola sp.]MDP3648283.1 16S rRNA (guanine(527)-N(7))-methyltransferase RsmG [Paracoccaceae bacterium]MDZ4065606.1 16S rRNA (guanine(527)-N(7))-methyltransferase RsmG [Tabrizicola sp.]
MTADLSIAGVDVSRETAATLRSFEAIVRRWSPAINLVSHSSLPDLWDRHIVDSAQLLHFYQSGSRSWVDIGSGAGFPGLVIAILAREKHASLKVTLIESDQRKATFLREAARQLSLQCDVIAQRAEAVPSLGADILSARAFSTLTSLLPVAERHLMPKGVAIFPKGKSWRDEVEDARKGWSFALDAVKSVSNNEAAVLVLKEISRVPHH